jgi:hypothetical protein
MRGPGGSSERGNVSPLESAHRTVPLDQRCCGMQLRFAIAVRIYTALRMIGWRRMK